MLKKYFPLLLAVLFTATFLVALFGSTPAQTDKLSCKTNNFTGVTNSDETLAIFEGRELAIPDIAFAPDADTEVLGASNAQKWIEVDLSDQLLTAWDGQEIYLQTPVSTGLPWWPTPTGEFRIWVKLRSTKMEGGEGRYYYYLPNVPYVMYFENDQVPARRGYGLHGAYWHNEFGTPRSHGCVNIAPDIAGLLYHWAGPVMPEGKSYVKSSPENPGTRIVIHD